MLAGQPIVVAPFCRRSWMTRDRLAPSSSASQAGVRQRSQCVQSFARQVQAGSKGYWPQSAHGLATPDKAHDASTVTGIVNDRQCHWFHRFSKLSFGKVFCVQLSWPYKWGSVLPLPFGHIVCLVHNSTAVRFNFASRWTCLDLPASWWLTPSEHLKVLFLFLLCEKKYFSNKGLKVLGVSGPTNPILLLCHSVLAALVVFQHIKTVLAHSVASVFFVLAM